MEMKRIRLIDDAVTSKGRLLVGSLVKLPKREADDLIKARKAKDPDGKSETGKKLEKIMQPTTPAVTKAATAMGKAPAKAVAAAEEKPEG